MFGLYEINYPIEMGLHLHEEEARLKRDLEHSYNTMTG